METLNSVPGGASNLSSLINPQVLKMFNMLPPGYNISKIPKEVIQQVTNGEMPDFALLPRDLQVIISSVSRTHFFQEHIHHNFEKFVDIYGSAVSV